MVKIAVVGSRGFKDYDYFSDKMDHILDTIIRKDVECFVSGGAIGADTFAEDYAKEIGKTTKVFKPDWKKHGKAAGYIRNKVIWDNADCGIAFWDGKSKGTSHSFKIAADSNKLLVIVNYTEDTIKVENNGKE